jgi:competence protein ComGG
MKNERGFIFPSTMAVILFCLLIVTHISMSLISEKKFYSETEQHYILENLMLIAVEQSLLEIKKGTAIPNEISTYNTFNGTFNYRMNEISPSLYEVELTCTSTKNRQYTAKYQYDLTKNDMILWSEY